MSLGCEEKLVDLEETHTGMRRIQHRKAPEPSYCDCDSTNHRSTVPYTYLVTLDKKLARKSPRICFRSSVKLLSENKAHN